jgi:hypothetical protein
MRGAALHARAIVSRQDAWAQVPYVWAARQHDALRKAADHSRLLEQARLFPDRPEPTSQLAWHAMSVERNAQVLHCAQRSPCAQPTRGGEPTLAQWMRH